MSREKEAIKLLEEVRHVLNMIPNHRDVGLDGESSYDMASKLDRFFRGESSEKSVKVEKKEKPERYTFYSSHGELVTDLEGNVIPEESSLDDYLADIKKFDIKELKEFLKSVGHDQEQKEFDILDVGFWTKDGTYADPEEDHRDRVYR